MRPDVPGHMGSVERDVRRVLQTLFALSDYQVEQRWMRVGVDPSKAPVPVPGIAGQQVGYGRGARFACFVSSSSNYPHVRTSVQTIVSPSSATGITAARIMRA